MNIQAAKAFFRDKKLPKSIKLSKWETVTDCELFVSTMLSTCEALQGTEAAKTCFSHLQRFAKAIEQQSQS